ADTTRGHLVLAPTHAPVRSAEEGGEASAQGTRRGHVEGRAAWGRRRPLGRGPGPLAASLGRRSPRRPSPLWNPPPWHPPLAPPLSLRGLRPLRSIKEPPKGGGALLGADLSGPSGHRPLGPSGRGERRRPRAPVAGCAVLRLATRGPGG